MTVEALLPIEVRAHGPSGPLVAVLHGGPGAPGSVASLTRLLSHDFRVLEPLQRHSGTVPLTVDRHVEDLAAVLPEPLAVVGWSWGAMLGLSFSVRHPELVKSLALVGCGTYDEASRAAYHRAMQAGRGAADRDAVDKHPLPVDEQGKDETWADVLRLQAEGVEPERFSVIRVPVRMFHGDADPHPGRATFELLRTQIPQLGLVELPNCGHTPWLESDAREPFLLKLRAWLREND